MISSSCFPAARSRNVGRPAPDPGRRLRVPRLQGQHPQRKGDGQKERTTARRNEGKKEGMSEEMSDGIRNCTCRLLLSRFANEIGCTDRAGGGATSVSPTCKRVFILVTSTSTATATFSC